MNNELPLISMSSAYKFENANLSGFQLNILFAK